MPTVRLTDARLSRLKPPRLKGQQVTYYDAGLPGFGVRLSYKGSRTFIVMRRVAGEKKPRRFRIGTHPGMSLADARSKAQEWIALAVNGDNPTKVAKAREEERRREEARQNANSFSTVVDQFLTAQGNRLRPRTLAEYKRVLTSADVAAWAARPITSITRADVIALRNAVDARNKPTLARHVIVYLGVFFNWCVDRDLIEASPTARVKAGAPLHSRERFLTDDELRVVLEALEPDAALRVFYGDVDLPPLADVARAYFRLLILTGQRRNEVAGMAWAELHDLDGEAPYWEIPGERAKNHRAHIVPLAPAAVTIIKRRWMVRNKSKLVLSATGKTPLTAFSHAKKMLDKRAAVICTALGRPPLPPWRAHDLRRTMVTHLNEMGFLPHAIEATVNHVSGAAKAGVAGTYNRAAYLPERRAALEAWAEKITALSSQSARPDPYAA